MRALHVTGGWWLGLFLPRDHVFADGSDGDVDMLAGPLEFGLDEEEIRAWIEAEASRLPLSTPRTTVLYLAGLRAAAGGLIRWPPRVDFLVGCEVKASWFQPATRTWKATHRNGARRLKGQLRFLLRQGLDRVGFLHLGSTDPGVHCGANPWLQAGADAAAAEEVFPEVYRASELPTCGYFTSVLGAVPFAAEHLSGASGALRIIQASRPNRRSADRGWRNTLLERLAGLPCPQTTTGFISACPACGRWSWQMDPTTPTCSCGLR